MCFLCCVQNTIFRRIYYICRYFKPILFVFLPSSTSDVINIHCIMSYSSIVSSSLSLSLSPFSLSLPTHTHTHTTTYITSIIQWVVGAVGKLVHEFSKFIENVHDHPTEDLTFAPSECNLLQLEVLLGCAEVVL